MYSPFPEAVEKRKSDLTIFHHNDTFEHEGVILGIYRMFLEKLDQWPHRDKTRFSWRLKRDSRLQCREAAGITEAFRGWRKRK